MAQSNLSKAIKKLNERIADMERHGIQGSQQYKSLVGSLDAIAKSSGLSLKTTATGHTAIPNSKKLTDDAQARLLRLAEGKNTYGRAKKQAERLLSGSNNVKEWHYYSPNGMEVMNEYTDYDSLKANGKSDDSIRDTLKEMGYKDSDIDYFINNEEHYLPTKNVYGYTQEQIADALELSERVHSVIEQYANAVYKLEDDGLISLHKNNGGDGKLTLSEMEQILSITEMSTADKERMAKAHEDNEERKKAEKSDANRQRTLQLEADVYNTDIDTYEKALDIYINQIDGGSMFEIIDAIKDGSINKYIYEHTGIPFT